MLDDKGLNIIYIFFITIFIISAVFTNNHMFWLYAVFFLTTFLFVTIMSYEDKIKQYKEVIKRLKNDTMLQYTNGKRKNVKK